MGWFFLAAVLLLADFLSKGWAHQNLPLLSEASSVYPYGGIALFQDFYGIDFSLNLATNKGAAWGAFASHSSLLLSFRSLFLFVLLFFLWKASTSLQRLSWLLIFCGALGNIIDSFYYGYVVDFLHFIFWGYDYPLFNFADSYIFLGVMILVFRR